MNNSDPSGNYPLDQQYITARPNRSAYDQLVEFGFHEFQAAVMVGNFIVESQNYVAGIDGELDLSMGQDGGNGVIGIAQCSSTSSRWKTPVGDGEQLHQSPYSLEVQVGFVITELTTAPGGLPNEGMSTALLDLNTTTNVVSATINFQDNYEKPAPASENQQLRIADAEVILGLYGRTSYPCYVAMGSALAASVSANTLATYSSLSIICRLRLDVIGR